VQRPRPDGEGAVGNRTPALAPQLYQSASGRSIPDASGILPDLTVRGAPRSDGERVFLATLGEDVGLFRSVLADYASDLRKNPHAPKFESFRVSEEMRGPVYERMQQIGLELPRSTFDNAAGYIDEQLGYEMARALFGAPAEARRRAYSDRQMQAAVRLLRRAKTQEDALGIAAAERSSGTSR
jgi:hypothetical protein